jgi:hypothetical protein
MPRPAPSGYGLRCPWASPRMKRWRYGSSHEQGATVTTGHLQRLVPDLSQEGAARLLSWLCQSNPGAWTTVSFLPLPNGGFAAAVIEPSEPMAEAGEGQDG